MLTPLIQKWSAVLAAAFYLVSFSSHGFAVEPAAFEVNGAQPVPEAPYIQDEDAAAETPQTSGSQQSDSIAFLQKSLGLVLPQFADGAGDPLLNSITAAINYGATHTAAPNVTVNLLHGPASSQNAQYQMAFSENGGEFSAYENFTEAKSLVLSNGDGLKAITVRLKNSANVTKDITASIVLDTGAPSGTMVVNNGADVTAANYLELAFTATGTPQSMRFSSDNGRTWTDWESYRAHAGFFLPNPDGDKELVSQLRYEDGRTIALTDRIFWDGHDPVVTASINNGETVTTGRDIVVHLAASDNFTPANELQMSFAIDSGAFSAYEPIASSRALTLPDESGIHHVHVRVRDHAGRAAESILDIELDKDGPAGFIRINDGSDVTTSRTVSVFTYLQDQGIASRNPVGSGIGLRRISLDAGATWSSWGNLEQTMTVTLPDGYGTKKIVIQAQDTFGNISEFFDTIQYTYQKSGSLAYVDPGIYELTLDHNFKDYLARVMPSSLTSPLSADDRVLVEMTAAEAYVKKTLADVYDFVVVLPTTKAFFDNLPFFTNYYYGYVLGLGGALVDDISGIGMPQMTAEELARFAPFDERLKQEFGTFHSSLLEDGTQQGAAMVDAYSVYYDIPAPNYADYVLLQELAHRWGMFLTSKGSVTSNPLGILGRDNAHWSYFFDAGLSPMDGFDWVDNGDGTFTLTHIEGLNFANGQIGGPVGYQFNDFDLYAMGLIDKSAVAPSFVIDNPRMMDGRALTEDNFADLAFADANFLSSRRIRGTRRNVTIQDVINIEGPRDPAYSSSQKDFSVAIVYMKDDSDGSVQTQAKQAQDRWKTLIDDIWATATRNHSTMALGVTNAAFSVFENKVLSLFDEAVGGGGQEPADVAKANENLTLLDTLDSLIQENEALITPLLETAKTNPSLKAFLDSTAANLEKIRQDAANYRALIQAALDTAADGSFIAGKRSEIDSKLLLTAFTGLLPAGFGSSVEAVIQEVKDSFNGVKNANQSFGTVSDSLKTSLANYKSKLERLSGAFPGRMVLSANAAYAAARGVSLELTNLPVPPVDPAAQQAYQLGQQLALHDLGRSYYNENGLLEKWIHSATGRWYYITPDGNVYRWLSGKSGELVGTVPAACYSDLTMFWTAPAAGSPDTGAESWITDARYRINGTEQGSLNGFKTGTASQTLTLTLADPDGSQNVEVVLTDSDGIEYTLAKTITLDRVKPTADFTINGGSAQTDNAEVELDLSQVKDTGSGIALVRLSLDGGSNWQTVDLSALVNGRMTVTLSSTAGRKRVRVEVTDKAGNKSLVEKTIVLKTGVFTGRMVLAGNAAYAAARGVTLELTDLPVPPVDPAAQQAYQLGQQLALHDLGRSYYNENGLQEKWIHSTTGRWYYITPDGNVYRWLSGKSGELVGSVPAACYSDLTMFWTAPAAGSPDTGAESWITDARYRINGTDQGSLSGFKTGTASQTLTLQLADPDGSQNVEVILTDSDGIEYTLTKTITLDRVKPTADFTINGGSAQTDNAEVELDLSQVKDTGSGIALVRLSLDGGSSWQTVDLSALVNGRMTATLSSTAGRKRVRVEVTDKAGNKSLVEKTIVLKTGVFSGQMVLAGNAAYAAARGVSLELTNLPVPPVDPAAQQAYQLGQQLALHDLGRSYYNESGLLEKWIHSTTGRWYYITPDGNVYRWLSGKSGELVGTVPAACYSDLTMFWTAPAAGSADTGAESWITSARYRINGTEMGSLSGFKAGTANQTLTLPLADLDGSQNAEVILTDSDGIEYTLTKTITLDRVKPTADFTINGGATQTDNAEVELDLSQVKDTGSGIALVRLSLDGGTAWQTVDLSALGNGRMAVTVSSTAGRKRLRLEVTDRAGNKSLVEKTIVLKTGVFTGRMVLAGNAAYAAVRGVTLELGDLPVPPVDPAAQQAYQLGQQLALHDLGRSYYNENGLLEKWIHSTTGRWYYITPDGNVYRWLSGKSGELVGSVPAACYSDLTMFWTAPAAGSADTGAESWITGARYRINGTEQGNLSGFKTGTANQTLTLPLADLDGSQNVEVILTDSDGIEYTLAKTITLDRVKPSADFTINGGATQTDNAEVELDLSQVKDTGSGIALVRLSLDGGTAWQTVDLSALVNGRMTATLSSTAGRKRLRLEVTDKAGNKSLVEKTIVLKTGVFSGQMVLSANAAYAAARGVSLELTNLPVPPVDPAAQQAYQLGQQLALHDLGRSYYNENGLQEKWIHSTTGRWYYITPDGNVYRWLGGKSGELVGTVPAACYSDLRMFWTVPAVSADTGAESWITGARYRINGTDQGSLSGFKAGTANQSLPLTLADLDGSQNVEVILTDSDEVEYTLTKTITLDRVKPSADFTINGGASQTDNAEVELDLSQVKDTGSGIALVRLSLDGGSTWQTVDLSALVNGRMTVTVSSAVGRKVLKVEATDKAGNAALVSREITLI